MVSEAKRLKSVEWSTLFLIFLCHGLWVAIGLCWQLEYGWLVLPLMAYLSAFQTSLQHETIHGHPTSQGWLNELLVSLPLAMAFPYRRYRDLHLKHHNDLYLTDPYEDPESYFWAEAACQRMNPVLKTLLDWNNTLVGRLLLGPLLSIIGFVKTEQRLLRANEPGIRLAWLLHIPGLVAVIVIVTQVFGMSLWMYLLGVVYPALSLVSLRSYAEHQAAENVGARSAIVETNPVLAMLYLNNNLHIVHHASPQTPWYDIPSLYKERREQYLMANDHLLFRGYWEIARRFAFTSKQTVEHPLWYRDEERID